MKSKLISLSQQHVKNVGLLVQCEECSKWWLLFCKHKLTVIEIADLQSILDDVSYTCGTTFYCASEEVDDADQRLPQC